MGLGHIEHPELVWVLPSDFPPFTTLTGYTWLHLVMQRLISIAFWVCVPFCVMASIRSAGALGFYTFILGGEYAVFSIATPALDTKVYFVILRAPPDTVGTTQMFVKLQDEWWSILLGWK